MKDLETEVRTLLRTEQQARKETLDRDRVETDFQVGNQVLYRTNELLGDGGGQ